MTRQDAVAVKIVEYEQKRDRHRSLGENSNIVVVYGLFFFFYSSHCCYRAMMSHTRHLGLVCSERSGLF